MKKLIILILIVLIGIYFFLRGKESSVSKDSDAPKQETVSDVPEEEDLPTADSSHLAFKGVPIDGTLKQYVRQMQKRGFKVESAKKESVRLTGDFAGFKDCAIDVFTLSQRDLVNSITVSFPPQETWERLSSDYFALKSMLTKKYGKPAKCTEKFQNASLYDDNGSKMFGVAQDACIYKTIYSTPKGGIRLSIEHQSYNYCYVQLMYADRQNSDIVRSDAMNDL